MLTPFNPISRLGKIKTNFYEVMTIFISSFISNGSDWWLDSHGAGPVKIDIDFGVFMAKLRSVIFLPPCRKLPLYFLSRPVS